LEYIKWVIRRETDNIMAKQKKDKRTNNDLQNTTPKTKDRATRTPPKNYRPSGKVKQLLLSLFFT
jgi:hypothetical protein